MAPVILKLRARREIETIVAVTGQHRETLDDALGAIDIKPQHDLDIMRPEQTFAGMTSLILEKLTPLIGDLKPARVIVHGDTTTAYAAAMASFYLGVPIGYVEAGLLTGNILAPWQEEFNRRCVDMIADLLWSPTEAADQTLRPEGSAAANIHVTGNTAVDAIRPTRERIEKDAAERARLRECLSRLDPRKKVVLVTGHRRESCGKTRQPGTCRS